MTFACPGLALRVRRATAPTTFRIPAALVTLVLVCTFAVPAAFGGQEPERTSAEWVRLLRTRLDRARAEGRAELIAGRLELAEAGLRQLVAARGRPLDEAALCKTAEHLSADLSRTLAVAERAAPLLSEAREERGALAARIDARDSAGWLRSTNELLAAAVPAIEREDWKEVERLGRDSARASREAALEYFATRRLRELERGLQDAAGHVDKEALVRARRTALLLRTHLDAARGSDFAVATKLDDLERRLREGLDWLYPPFYRAPPSTLILGAFRLTVERYDLRSWDHSRRVIVGAGGLAWVTFDCSIGPGPFPPWYWELDKRRLRVVEVVRDPRRELELVEALRFDAQARIGSDVEVALPRALELVRPLRVHELAEQLELAPGILEHFLTPPSEGAILVRFEDLTIEPTATPYVGKVTAGRAFYPTTPRRPLEAVLDIAGFELVLDELVLEPTSAVARARLRLPDRVIDPKTCARPELDLGWIDISPTCVFRAKSDDAWGPWVIGDTGIELQGTGYVADFDSGWAPPGATGAASTPSWRGLFLPTGVSVPLASGTLTSNTGYLRAGYRFSDATVVASGFAGRLNLDGDFQFRTTLPFAYHVELTAGVLRIGQSRVLGGTFANGELLLPKRAVREVGGGSVPARYATLAVQPDLDLFGEVDVHGLAWGELESTPGEPVFYDARGVHSAYFSLAGPYEAPRDMVDASGFRDAAIVWPPETGLEAEHLRGVTVMNFEVLEAFTVDVPTPPGPLRFHTQGSTWLNVAGQGVNARIVLESGEPDQIELGPTHEPTYVAAKPLQIDWGTWRDKERNLGELHFVDSAVYASDLSGFVTLDGPSQVVIPFEQVGFTSTAEIPGALIDLSNPVPLDYWGVDLVQDPSASSAGVMSVKTGQIFLTQAGIAEPRHFAEPFWLIWGELLADGNFGRLFFDYGVGGQRFDGFLLSTQGVGLSAWSPGADKKTAFLQAGGLALYDFFGANALNVRDFNHPDELLPPFDGRRIELASDNRFGTPPTDFDVERDWGGGLGTADFEIRYDEGDQDGFLGDGAMGLDFVHDGALTATLVMASDLICMNVSDTSRHDFTLGPVANFGSMSRISACACIEDGELKRLLLTSELEASGNANVALRSGVYGKLDMLITPSLTETRVHGNLYLSVIAGGDLEVDGHARFTVDRDDDYVEGDIEGTIDTRFLLSGVRANGRLNWHLGRFGGDSYQLIQGRLGIEVMSAVAGASVEGGFFLGVNAPTSEGWVLADKDGRFSLNPASLPARVTGFYGYARVSDSVNFYIISGGFELFAGFGAFVNIGSADSLSSGIPGIPFVVGNLGIRLWGEILGGLVSASAWGNIQMVGPVPFHFQGTVGLEGCVAWVICASVDITVGLGSGGFFLD